MSIRVCVVLLAVLIGTASALKSTKAPETKGQCVDNTLYAKYLCRNRPDGEKYTVPGKCGEYYECSKGESKKKSCPKFYDSAKQKCVNESKCVEVDDTDCVIPTPPPLCNVTPKPPAPGPCECPPTPVTPAPPKCPTPPTCRPPTECPKPPKCPKPTQCPTPAPCPGTTSKPQRVML